MLTILHDSYISKAANNIFTSSVISYLCTIAIALRPGERTKSLLIALCVTVIDSLYRMPGWGYFTDGDDTEIFI